jgi:hypothetical protein
LLEHPEEVERMQKANENHVPDEAYHEFFVADVNHDGFGGSTSISLLLSPLLRAPLHANPTPTSSTPLTSPTTSSLTIIHLNLYGAGIFISFDINLYCSF